MNERENRIKYLQAKFLIMLTIISITIIAYCIFTNQITWEPFAFLIYGWSSSVAIYWDELKELYYLTKTKVQE